MEIKLSPKELARLEVVYRQQPGWIKAMYPDLEAYALYLFLKQLSHMEDDFMPRYLAAVRAESVTKTRPANQLVTVERTASRRPARAESVTETRVCACGCGKQVSGKATYFNSGCRMRALRRREVGV